MANPVLLAFGLILGLTFAVFLIRFVLPKLDQSVKKNRGPVEACLVTRFCCLVICIPLYVFTVWMMLVVLFGSDGGFEVLRELCPDDYDCIGFLSVRLGDFDKDACTSADCGFKALSKRAGSSRFYFEDLERLDENTTIKFPAIEMDNETRSYTCSSIVSSPEGDFCAEAKVGSDECQCSNTTWDFDQGLCQKWVGCFDDVEDASYEATCLDENAGVCVLWEVATDSVKQFSFATCNCTQQSTVCEKWTCSELTVLYYYPNVVFGFLVTLGFVLPLLLILWVEIKTQLKKVCPCNDTEIYVHSQAGGMGQEVRAEEFLTGGFVHEDTDRKQKWRSWSWKDIALYITIPLLLTFFIYLIYFESGKLGIGMVIFALLGIVAHQTYALIRFKYDQIQRLNERKAEQASDRNRYNIE